MARNSRQLSSWIRKFAVRSDGNLAWRRIAVVAALVVAYLVLQPWLVRSFGLPLPGLADVGEIADVDSPETAPQAGANNKANGSPETSSASRSDATGRSSDRSRQSGHDAPRDDARATTSPVDSQDAVAQFLRKVDRDVYESPAGLRYTRGSRQGHRIKHVMAHARDNPTRQGQHGVFDPGDGLAVFQLVDHAFEQALSGIRTTTKHEGKRTVYTVDLGRQIGYVGGQTGKRNNHPAAQHIRLVLQGKNVITAFPLIP